MSRKKVGIMGDRSAEMLNIMIAVISIVALMALGFAIFTIAKRMANNSQNDLVNQLGQISSSLYTDLDQAVITGARLKGVVQQASTSDCAIIISTLGFLGAQTKLGDKVGVTGTTQAEASLNGNVEKDMRITAVKLDGSKTASKAPVIQLEGLALSTALGTKIRKPLAVNFGSILKNSVKAPEGPMPSAGEDDTRWGDDGSVYQSTFSVSNGTTNMALADIADFSQSPEYTQTIRYKDGEFTTKLEYATNLINNKILRYDMTSDFSKTGQTFSIPDTAQFNSYVLKNASGEYLGLVFTQLRK